MVRITIMHDVHLGALDLNLLRVLDVLLAERNVSRAATRLGLSQSATSHALGRLRDLFSDPLLVRTRLGMEPTARAMALAPRLRAALVSLETALARTPDFAPDKTQRTFNVATTDYVALVMLPNLAAHLQREAPGVDLWVRRPGTAANPLVRDEADVVLAPLRPEDAAAGIKTRALFGERFVLVMRKGHPLSKGRITPERFAAARHAFIAPQGTPGGIVDEVLARHGLTRRVAVAVPDFLVAPHVVAGSDLVLTLAARLAGVLARTLPLHVVGHPLELPHFTVSMLWHARHDADPAHRWFRALVAKVSRDLPR